MKNIELLSGDVAQEKVKAKNFPYVAFSPKENTVYYTSAPEPDQIIYTTLSGSSIAPNWFRCDLVEMSNTYNDTKTAGCVLFEAPIMHITSLQNNSSLTSVIIPEGVETIAEKAFYRCSNLNKVVLPKSIKHIGSMAFCGTKLSPDVSRQVNIPIYVSNWLLPSVEDRAYSYSTDVYNVKYGTVGIGPNTFRNANINKIHLPDTVKVIGDNAFYSSTINEICLPSALEAIGKDVFSGCTSLKSVTIPSSVTSIGEGAFRDCSALISVTIPESVELIGENAFYNCSSLTSITLPASVTSIGEQAFYYCSKLTSITIPNSVTSIGDHAFYFCSSLKSVTISESVTSIGEYAFHNGSSLTSIVVAEGNTVYDSREQCNAIIETATNTLLTGCQNTVIPSSVTSIGRGAFNSCTSITSMVIPDGVTRIGNNAFYSCTSLTSIVMGNSVTSIESAAFSSCKALTSITIPESVTSIGDNAFHKCNKLTSVTINSDTIVGSTSSSSSRMSTIFGSQVTKYIIGDSVNDIRDQAFSNCSKLKSVTILNGATSIGYLAFSSCSSLTSITIPESVASIGGQAFYNCSLLNSVTIPNGVASIGEGAFYGCSKLASMAIPESVTSIGNDAFKNCSSLTTINVDTNNPNYSSVDDVLFNKDQTTLIQYPMGNTRSEYTIPNSVTSIEEEAFLSCTYLTSVVIPENVTTMGASVLSGCSLDSIYFQSDTPPASSEDALVGSTIAVIYVPHHSLDEYKASPLLKDHISKIVSGYVPETCTSLTATASDVQYGQLTTTTIAWEAITSGHDRCTGELLENIPITGTSISDEFELNLSETDSVERTIPFTYLGTTVECTFTQGPVAPKSCTIDLNNSWELQPTNSNPNIEEYEGVYQSFSNKGKSNTAAIMYLDLFGYDTFTIYVRSNGESNFDYVIVGQPNTTITNSTSINNTSLVKAHTKGKASSSTDLSAYTAVTFTGLDCCTNSRIPIAYIKDSSGNSGDDRGYLLIPKNQ